MNDQALRLTAYRRVSSKGQVLDGLGLPVQEKRLKADAKAKGHRITGWESDPGITGRKTRLPVLGSWRFSTPSRQAGARVST